MWVLPPGLNFNPVDGHKVCFFKISICKRSISIQCVKYKVELKNIFWKFGHLVSFATNTLFSLLWRQMPLKRAKLGMVPEDQLSILLASALNSSMIKVSLFYWLKRKERKPRTILLLSLRFSICKSGGKASLHHVQAIWAKWASPVAVSDSGHALLPHLISWEGICACSAREGGHKLNWVTCSKMVSFSTDGPGDPWWNC